VTSVPVGPRQRSAGHDEDVTPSGSPADSTSPRTASSRARVRMTGAQRRQQLLDVGRELFAQRGYEATSIEEIASRADVSKPVVYEHFGGKEGLYAVVVDREMQRLLDRFTSALSSGGHPRELLERAALVLLDYIEDETDGFRVLSRDSPVVGTSGTFSSLIGEVARKVEHILAAQFSTTGYDPRLAELYSQALVGMVALVGQWWLDTRQPDKRQVAAHLVNLAYNGLSSLETRPQLIGQPRLAPSPESPAT
jgi:AcrR family transcriptional regulator